MYSERGKSFQYGIVPVARYSPALLRKSINTMFKNTKDKSEHFHILWTKCRHIPINIHHSRYIITYGFLKRIQPHIFLWLNQYAYFYY